MGSRKRKLAVFASGNGSNAENICSYFRSSDHIEVELILSNNPKAFVLTRAERLGVRSLVFSQDEFAHSDFLKKLASIDYVILAGFLQKIPLYMLAAFPNKILNIHPSLLPKYGGKGMYGLHVHRAVKRAGDPTSGITVHLVNAHYDQGKILFQKECSVFEEDTPASLAARVHALEHTHFPKQIEKYISSQP